MNEKYNGARAGGGEPPTWPTPKAQENMLRAQGGPSTAVLQIDVAGFDVRATLVPPPAEGRAPTAAQEEAAVLQRVARQMAEDTAFASVLLKNLRWSEECGRLRRAANEGGGDPCCGCEFDDDCEGENDGD
jgi:hypothetical protein